METVLNGVRVLELGQIITAPLAGMMLADLGADVIKIENPDGGDPFRAFRGGAYSPHFTAYNRNKRSMTLNLRTAEGRQLALRLIEQADVLLENFRPDVLPRLGLDAATLERANPRLIHASITGFGGDGPYVERPAFDSVGVALSGMGSLFFDKDHADMRGPTIVDNVSGMYCCYGILGALIERARSGKGRRVEVNMLEAAIAFIPDPFANWHQLGLKQGPYSRTESSQSFVFACADDKLVAIHLSSQPKFWEGLLRAIELPQWADDPRYKTRPDRMTHYLVLREELAQVFRTRARAEWMARLADADVPFAPVNAISEVASDPQVEHLRTFYAIHHPQHGEQKSIHRPVRIDQRRGPTQRAAPTYGEHTAEVLAQLGIAATEIARLKAQGVV